MSCTSLKKLQMQPPTFGPCPSEPPVQATPIVSLSTLVQHSPLVAEVIQPTCTVATGSATIFDLPDYGWTLTLLPDGLIVIGIGFHFTFENLPAGTYQFSVEDEF